MSDEKETDQDQEKPATPDPGRPMKGSQEKLFDKRGSEKAG